MSCGGHMLYVRAIPNSAAAASIRSAASDNRPGLLGRVRHRDVRMDVDDWGTGVPEVFATSEVLPGHVVFGGGSRFIAFPVDGESAYHQFYTSVSTARGNVRPASRASIRIRKAMRSARKSGSKRCGNADRLGSNLGPVRFEPRPLSRWVGPAPSALLRRQRGGFLSIRRISTIAAYNHFK